MFGRLIIIQVAWTMDSNSEISVIRAGARFLVSGVIN